MAYCVDVLTEPDGAGGFASHLVLNSALAPPDCWLLVMDQAEYNALQPSGFFSNLTADDGALIAGAILAVWATGYAFRVLIRFLKEADESSQST